MNTQSKLTIHLSPEEVEKAITYYVHATYGAQIQDGHPVVKFNIETINGEPGQEEVVFFGATVEVTP